LSGCSVRLNRNIELVKRVDLFDYIDPKALVVQGNMVYGVDHGELIVLDVSDPLDPQWIASLDLEWGSGQDIAVDGQYAYLAANGLVVVDVSDPSNPKEVYAYTLDTRALDIKIKEHYVYLAGLENGLLIFDVSDPSQPELVSQIEVSYGDPDESAYGSVRAVNVAEQYAYVVGEANDRFVEVQDISDPTSPRVVGHYMPEPRHGPHDIVVQGRYAYLNGRRLTIDIIDISDPLTLRPVGSVKTLGLAQRYVVDGDYVYVANIGNINVIDVSNPEKPRVVGFYDIDTSSVAKVGDYLYVVGRTRRETQLHIFEFTP
jgi:hypothetical protein